MPILLALMVAGALLVASAIAVTLMTSSPNTARLVPQRLPRSDKRVAGRGRR